MLEKEPEYFPGGIRPSRIGVRAGRAAARPCMSGSVDIPVLKDFPPTRVGMDRTGIGMSSRYPPAVQCLLRARCSDRLCKNMIGVARMHRHVAIAVKNDGRDSRSASWNLPVGGPGRSCWTTLSHRDKR